MDAPGSTRAPSSIIGMSIKSDVPTDAEGLAAHYRAVKARLRGAGNIIDPEAPMLKPLIMLSSGGAYDPNTKKFVDAPASPAVVAAKEPAAAPRAERKPRAPKLKVEAEAEPKIKRRPGRPRKNPIPEPAPADTVVTVAPDSDVDGATQPAFDRVQDDAVVANFLNSLADGAQPDDANALLAFRDAFLKPDAEVPTHHDPDPTPADSDEAIEASAEEVSPPLAAEVEVVDPMPGLKTEPVFMTIAEAIAADPLTPDWLRRWDETYPRNAHEIVAAVVRRHGLVRRHLNERPYVAARSEAIWWLSRLTALTNREIGSLFNVTASCVYGSIKRHAADAGLPDLTIVELQGEDA